MNRQDYLAKKEVNKQHKVDAGLVSERFPGVSGIVIQMFYYRKSSNPAPMIRTVNFFPSSYAYFHMECMMKECVNGGFDLTSVIDTMIKKHRNSETGKMICSGKNDSLTGDHARISYEISVQYNKRSG